MAQTVRMHGVRRQLWPVVQLLLAIGSGTALADSPTPTPLTISLPDGLSPRTVGFYLAQDKGYYAAAGLSVTFAAGSGGTLPSDALMNRKADLAVELMPIALRRREAGDKLVNVAQVFRAPGMELICRPLVDHPAALKNRVVSVRFNGLESSFYALMTALSLNPFGGPGSVTVLRQNTGLDAFQRFQADCATSFTYAAPLDLAAAGIALQDLKTYRYRDLGDGTLEDGLYAREADLGSADRIAAFAAFLGAAAKGWRFGHDNPKAAFDLLRADPDYAGVDQAALHQAIDAADDLVAFDKGPFGKLDPDAYDRTVNLLLTAAPDPVLTAPPSGAVSDAVVKSAFGGN